MMRRQQRAWVGGLWVALLALACGEAETPAPASGPARPVLAEESWRALPGAARPALRAVAGRAGEWYGVGAKGLLARSSDEGKTWLVHPRHGTTQENLYGVVGRSAQELYAVGNRGVILRSEDAGETWASVPSGVSHNLNGVFVAGGSLFAVGDQGTILASVDGRTWEARPSGAEAELEAGVESPAGLFVVGRQGTILRSRDQGRSWEALSPGVRGDLLKIAALGERELYAVGGEPGKGLILSSVDGGDSWRVTKGDGTIAFSQVWTVGTSAYMLGFGNTILKTSDHGISLSAAGRGGDTALSAGAAVAPGGALFLADANGELFRSTDNATTFRSLGNPTQEALSGLWFSDREHGIAVGYRGQILRTKDGGTSWESLRDGTSQDLAAVFSPAPGVAYAGGPGAFVRTDDQGASWRAPTILGMPEIDTLWGLGAETVYVLGGGNVQRTADGGKTWAAPRGLIKEAGWGAVFGVAGSEGNFYAVGEAGGLYYSPDGKTWERRESGVSVALRAVVVAESGLYVAGDEGTLLRSKDGARWSRAALGVEVPFQVLAAGKGGVFALSRGELLLHSADGESWTRVRLGAGAAPLDVFVHEKGPVALGADGHLYTP